MYRTPTSSLATSGHRSIARSLVLQAEARCAALAAGLLAGRVARAGDRASASSWRPRWSAWHRVQFTPAPRSSRSTGSRLCHDAAMGSSRSMPQACVAWPGASCSAALPTDALPSAAGSVSVADRTGSHRLRVRHPDSPQRPRVSRRSSTLSNASASTACGSASGSVATHARPSRRHGVRRGSHDAG